MTTEEFIEKQLSISFKEEPGSFTIHALALKVLLVEFAKHHVELANKSARNFIMYADDNLEVYSLENIK